MPARAVADAVANVRRRLQNPDFPPGCGSGSGARTLPDDAFGGARDCQESCTGRNRYGGVQRVYCTPLGLFLHTSIPCVWSIRSFFSPP